MNEEGNSVFKLQIVKILEMQFLFSKKTVIKTQLLITTNHRRSPGGAGLVHIWHHSTLTFQQWVFGRPVGRNDASDASSALPQCRASW